VRKQTYTSEVKDKKLSVYATNKIKEVIESMEGKRIQITLGNPRRSTKQNNSYWGIAVPLLADYLGYSNEEMHELLRFQFLKAFKEDKKTGIMFEYVRSTTDLDTLEFNEYYEKIQRWAAIMFHVEIPDPEKKEE